MPLIIPLGIAAAALSTGALLALALTLVLPARVNIRHSRRMLTGMLAGILALVLLLTSARDPEPWAIAGLLLGGFFSYLEFYARH
ncbi:MAG TPA: hypothetical protein PKH77_09735 [Anaerolineae bacterium]|nr:hypothetical protein [Anaerolineae bacterium]